MPEPRREERVPLSLVVPLFNERDRFTESVDDLVAFVRDGPDPGELVYVDDGSTDGTAEFVEKRLAKEDAVEARVVRRPHLGKGAAVTAGLRAATGSLVAFCDVDLATPLADLDRVVAVARETGGLAIGSRAAPDANLVQREHLTRETLGRAYNLLLRLTIVRGIHDTQCGAKAAPREVWTRLLAHARETGFAWDAEVVAIAQRLGIDVREVGVSWSHDERTTVRTVRDGARLVAAVPRIAFRLRGI